MSEHFGTNRERRAEPGGISPGPEFDAFLLFFYGGPENRSEIEPFLDRVLAGKNIPPERRAAATEKYHQLAGKSPGPEEARRFLRRLEHLFEEKSETLRQRFSGDIPSRPPRFYLAGLFSEPSIETTVRRMVADGIRRPLGMIGGFGSGVGCRRYRDALDGAVASVSNEGKRPLEMTWVGPFWQESAFLRVWSDRLLEWRASESLAEFDHGVHPTEQTAPPLILFSAHALPLAEATRSGYVTQLETFCRRVIEACGAPQTRFAELVSPPHDAVWELVFQSRSGNRSEPWTGPTAVEILERWRKIVPKPTPLSILPVGFFFENMETVFDLDRELVGMATELGFHVRRARTVGVTPEMVSLAAEFFLRPKKSFPDCPAPPGDCVDCTRIDCT